ncbi:MAG: hypothetical protein JKX98_10215 [Alcanivoracaceae bacterium]|nr:hypothetical protein [Alcanivoracaceae bacterium]
MKLYLTAILLLSISSFINSKESQVDSEFDLLNQELLAENKVTVAGIIGGKINKVHAGSDNFYGVRFYLDITNDTTGTNCNSAFVYTAPNPITQAAPVDLSGHKSKISTFLSAYMSNKNVAFTVETGRNGYCKIVEGYMN